MGKPVAIFQHAENEGPGKLLPLLEKRGLKTEIIFWPTVSSHTPQAEDFSACVILGGAMNIYQHRDHPWLVSEKSMLMDFLSSGCPMLGICLGAQLIADALGGKVVQNHVEEIGWWPVEFSAIAQQYFPAMPERASVLHWHGDTFSLPEGAELLASSVGCKNQGFVFGNSVVGLQFHPEVDASLARDFCCSEDDVVWPEGEWVQPRKVLLDSTLKHQLETDKILHVVLDFLFPPTTESTRNPIT